jgi:hypothetical protein
MRHQRTAYETNLKTFGSLKMALGAYDNALSSQPSDLNIYPPH